MTHSPHPPSPDPADPPRSDVEPRWTKEKMGEFLNRLAATQCVASAAKCVGMSRQSAYRLRNRLKGEPFDIAWEAAFQHGYDALHQAALERALHGVEVPIFHHGEQVGTRRHYDERLTVFLLARRNAQGAQRLSRYGAAAEFWSQRWDQLVKRVVEGPVEWQAPEPESEDDFEGADGAAAAALLRDSDKAAEGMLYRHALDAGEEQTRFGKFR